MIRNLRVFVYRNLANKLFSLRDKQGIVIAHADTLFLTNCEFKVSEAGRQRVLKEKRKNVHAGVEGNVKFAYDVDDYAYDAVKYNPYVRDCFWNERTGDKVESADVVMLYAGKIWIAS